MSWQDDRSKKSKLQTSQQRFCQRYAERTKLGKCIEILDNGVSKFDQVIGKLGDIEEGGRVYLADNKSCTGTVKWIGRYHKHPGTEVDEAYYIVGVKLETMKSTYQHYCSYGELDDEPLIQTAQKDVLFRQFPDWVPIEEQTPVCGRTGKGATGAKKSKGSTQNAESTCNGQIRQSPQSKFDRIDLDVNGFHVGSRVKLDTGSVGTVRWIGCYHKKVVKLNDYIVGVELAGTPSKEFMSLLTNGVYEGERLVESKKNNIKFTKLKNLSNEAAEVKPSTTSAAAKGTRKAVPALNGKPIELCHDDKSSYQRARHGMAGIQDGDRVHLDSDKTRTGTVKWIGCGYGLSSKTDSKDFLVGVEVDKPENEDPDTLTNGTYYNKRLVHSQRKNVVFTTVNFCTAMEYSNRTDTENIAKTPLKEDWSDVPTLDGFLIRIYHSGKSAFDRAPYGVAGFQDGDRVYLHSKISRTGTVKWIGCYHGHVYDTKSTDFLVGVELDKPEMEDPDNLTDGRYLQERLVFSGRRNVVFTKLKLWALVECANTKTKVTNDKPSTISALEEIAIEASHDGKSTVVNVRCDDRVQLYSNPSRTGTVRWLGIRHRQTAVTDQQEFIAGVEVDNPDSEPEDTLTDGTYCGKRLVNSQRWNVVFANLKYCALVGDVDTKPETNEATNLTKEVWSTVKTLGGIPIEIYNDGTSAFDRVRYGIAGIQYADKVYLYSDKARTGTVKWIGCDHDKASMRDPKDFLVAVEMDSPKKETRGVLTDGSYCREQLVISQTRNVMFLKLQYVALIVNPDTKSEKTNGAKYNDELSNVNTRDGFSIEIFHDGKSAFDRVLYGIAGIQYNDRVQLYSDKARTGTVKWIGCDHGQAFETDLKAFLVGVQVDEEKNERPDMLTDGTFCDEHLVISQRRNVMFIKLKYCSLFEPEREPEMVNAKKTQSQEVWSTVYKPGGIPIEIYHDGKSAFDRVCSGIAGIQYDARVHLRSDQTRTGAVKWIGCDHGLAYKKDPKDFWIGVEVDKPEKEHPDALSCGTYYKEQLVATNKRNIKFTQLKYWALVEPEGKPPTMDPKPQLSGTVKTERIPNGYPVELYYDGKSDFDRVCHEIAGIQDGDRVHMYIDKSVTGTVRWLGCFHGAASETDHDDFLVGVQLDKPENDDPDQLTDGTYYGEQLVLSENKNVVFNSLKYWTLAGQSDMRSKASNITHRPNERPPTHGKDSNLPEEAKVTPDQETYGNGSVVNRSKRTELLGLHAADKNVQRFNLLSALDRVATEHNQEGAEDSALGHGFGTGHIRNVASVQNSRRYHFARENVATDNLSITEPESMREGNLSLHDRQNSSEPQKILPRQNSRSNTVSLNRENSLNNEDRISSLNEILASNETVPHEEMSPTSQRRPKPAPRHPIVQGSPTQPLNTDDVRRLKVFSEGIENAFIENKPTKSLSYVKHKVGAEMMQKMASGNIPTRENARASTTTHETVRYATPQPTTAPVPVSSKSTDDYLPMDTEHFAEHDYSWTRDQFDAGFLLRGTATQQGDKTYRTVIVALKPSEKDLADESGEPLEDVVNEVVLPPTHPEQYNDFWKGVQGDLNSCYMDASMFAMFSYLTVFDDILYGKGATTDHSKGEDVKQTENIRQVLRTQIVNPLRKYGLAQKKGMHVLRNLLDELGLVKGLTGDEKDPEEFLNLLLVNTFATPSPIVLNNGQESHLFHLLAEKEEGMDFPTVQELVERTCLQENFKFSKIPPYLILHLPRFGKDFKMYEKIMPSLELDVTDVISGTSQSCYICEAVATHECYGCYKDCYNISGSCFCNGCVVDYHRAPTRRDHKPQKLVVAEKDDGLATAKCVLKLAAVLCIETSHYVTFVASDTTAAARWYFFDSMADREGTTNIPQVREVPEFRTHLSEAKKSVDGVPPLIRRLVKDGYICFYTNPDVPQYYALGTPLNVTMPGGTTNL